MNYIVMSSLTGTYMLCGDKRWRVNPMFGTYSWCLKEYKTKGHAISVANKMSRRGNSNVSIFVLSVDSKRITPNDEYEFTSDGKIYFNGKTFTIKGLIEDQVDNVNDSPITVQAIS